MKLLTTFQKSKIDKEILIGANRKIVVLDFLGERGLSLSEENENIYMVNENYHILWKIQTKESPWTKNQQRLYPDEPSRWGDPFVTIWKDNKGGIYARRFFGHEYKICVETGKAELSGWSK